jgi:hypothetical protein
MIALAAALVVASGAPAFAPPPEPDLGGRIAASAAAAQAWQGPLDGAWTLYDARRRPVLSLEITDPAGGGPLEGAWRAADPATSSGFVEAIERRGARLTLRLAPEAGGPATLVTLRRRGSRSWRGWIMRDGVRRPATLERGAWP